MVPPALQIRVPNVNSPKIFESSCSSPTTPVSYNHFNLDDTQPKQQPQAAPQKVPPKAPTTADKVGCVLNNTYYLAKVLGSGACGTVYYAKSLVDGREVAIKTMLKPAPGFNMGIPISPTTQTTNTHNSSKSYQNRWESSNNVAFRQRNIEAVPICFSRPELERFQYIQLKTGSEQVVKDIYANKALFTEVSLHSSVHNHPNIVKIIEVLDSYDYLFVVLEYCSLGDLFTAITERNWYVGNDEYVKLMFTQLLNAVDYCHNNGVYHCDLKPENVMVINNGRELKIADFGLASKTPICTVFGRGSSYYMAPETIPENQIYRQVSKPGERDLTESGKDNKVLQMQIKADLEHRKRYHNQRRTKRPLQSKGYPRSASDVWALGVILLNLIFGRNPWKKASLVEDPAYRDYSSNPETLRAVLPVSHELNLIMAQIFHPNPYRRIKIPELKILINKCDRLTNPTAEFPWFKTLKHKERKKHTKETSSVDAGTGNTTDKTVDAPAAVIQPAVQVRHIQQTSAVPKICHVPQVHKAQEPREILAKPKVIRAQIPNKIMVPAVVQHPKPSSKTFQTALKTDRDSKPHSENHNPQIEHCDPVVKPSSDIPAQTTSLFNFAPNDKKVGEYVYDSVRAVSETESNSSGSHYSERTVAGQQKSSTPTTPMTESIEGNTESSEKKFGNCLNNQGSGSVSECSLSAFEAEDVNYGKATANVGKGESRHYPGDQSEFEKLSNKESNQQENQTVFNDCLASQNLDHNIYKTAKNPFSDTVCETVETNNVANNSDDVNSVFGLSHFVKVNNISPDKIYNIPNLNNTTSNTTEVNRYNNGAKKTNTFMQSPSQIDIVVSSCDTTSPNPLQNASQKSTNRTSNSKPHVSNTNLIFSNPAHINSLISIHKNNHCMSADSIKKDSKLSVSPHQYTLEISNSGRKRKVYDESTNSRDSNPSQNRIESSILSETNCLDDVDMISISSNSTQLENQNGQHVTLQLPGSQTPFSNYGISRTSNPSSALTDFIQNMVASNGGSAAANAAMATAAAATAFHQKMEQLYNNINFDTMSRRESRNSNISNFGNNHGSSSSGSSFDSMSSLNSTNSINSMVSNMNAAPLVSSNGVLCSNNGIGQTTMHREQGVNGANNGHQFCGVSGLMNYSFYHGAGAHGAAYIQPTNELNSNTPAPNGIYQGHNVYGYGSFKRFRSKSFSSV